MSVLRSGADSKDIVLFQPKKSPEEFIHAELEKKVSEVMRSSLESAKYFANRLKLFGEGKIFCLIGTSTAGKTSIIQRLKEGSSEWRELGFDLEADLYVADEIKANMRAQYDEIIEAIDPSNVAIAVFCDQVKLKDNVPSSVVEKAYKALEEVKKARGEIVKKFGNNFGSAVESRVLDKAVSLSLKGQNVIFDFFDMDLFIQSLMGLHFCSPIRFGLVYCPLDQLVERVLIRNKRAHEEGDGSNIRPPMQLLFQFVDKYIGIVNPQEKDKVLDALTLNQFEEIFEKAFSEEIEFLEKKLIQCEDKVPLRKEIEEFRKKHDKIKNELMEKLGFTDFSIKKVFIVSRFRDYHHLFNNTQIMSPQNSSQFIRELPY